MLWGQSKKIRDDLDAILLRIGHIEHSIESIRDNARQMHHDISDKQKTANEKLDEIKEDTKKIMEFKKDKPIKKTRSVSTIPI